jgi:hypothetical protein
MKKILGLAALTASIFGCSTAFAQQTCAAPGSWIPDATGNPALVGDTCGGSSEFISLCQLGTSDNPHPERIYRVVLAAAGPARTATSVTVAGGNASFTPLAGIYGGDCNNNSDNCAQVAAAGESFPLAAVAAGTYFLAVTAASFDAPNACGPFTLTTNGTFPVSLQNFSVE